LYRIDTEYMVAPAAMRLHSAIIHADRAIMSRRLLFSVFALMLAGATQAQTPPANQAATPAQTPATSAATTAAPTAGATVGDRNTTLADRIPPEQQLALQAGDDRFAARYIANLHAKLRGAVLVLHDSGQHQSWPNTVAALLDELPLHGWSTLALELPAPAAAAPNPSAPTAPPASPAPATTPAPAPAPAALLTGSETGTEKQAQARIDAAVAKLAELHSGKPQPTVVIGFGSGAWRAAEFARRQAEGNGAPSANNKPIGPEPLRALVLVDPVSQPLATIVDLPKLLPATTLPTLDLVQSSAAQTRADAEARRRAVLHQRERIYQRLSLPPLNAQGTRDQTVLIKRIRSWVQRYVPAEEAVSAQTKR
jgi:dienelactone hydrolase